jgi:hypothetical protein
MNYVELVTDVQSLIRRDLSVADRTLVKPSTANVILDGEFLFVDTASKAVRAAGAGIGWMVFTEKGRFDVQATGKVTVLYGGTYEADTQVFTASGLTLGGKVEIGAAVDIGDGQSRSGLVNYSSGEVVGYVTRLPANNGNKLRFIQTLF